MARKSYTTEQIIGLLRQAEVMLSQGKTLDTVRGVASPPDMEECLPVKPTNFPANICAPLTGPSVLLLEIQPFKPLNARNWP